MISFCTGFAPYGGSAAIAVDNCSINPLVINSGEAIASRGGSADTGKGKGSRGGGRGRRSAFCIKQ